MGVISVLTSVWEGHDAPFMVSGNRKLAFSDLIAANDTLLDEVSPGDVVALIGDFEPTSIRHLLHLADIGAIIVPLTAATRHDHEYFFDTANVQWIVEGETLHRRDIPPQQEVNPLITSLRDIHHGGLVLFTSGTTGRPKGILHDMTLFLERFKTPRPSLRTLSFLLFDHIGGLNTLFHTLYNRGVVVSPAQRDVESILEAIRTFDVEVLPTTPSFLRMMLLSGNLAERVSPKLKVITYGTERMDLSTLIALCEELPWVDFRQTFGMSELGILRVKSKSRDSLWMSVGGEGVETRVVGDVLQIRSSTRMLGYLNAASPFDNEGWYNTRDIVEVDSDGYIRVVGRDSEVINVGGLKFMASEVERHVLTYPTVSFAKAIARPNPITGEHVELEVQVEDESTFDSSALRAYLDERLPGHMRPRRIRIEKATINHRFKRM